MKISWFERNFQVDDWLKKENPSMGPEEIREMREKITDISNANRELRLNMQEFMANLSVSRAEVAHVTMKYDEKCRELHQLVYSNKFST